MSEQTWGERHKALEDLYARLLRGEVESAEYVAALKRSLREARPVRPGDHWRRRAERFEAALAELADPDNWTVSTTPGEEEALMYGHFQPWEIAQRALATTEEGNDG